MKNSATRLMIFIILVLLMATGHAQNPNWINYTNGDKVTAIVENGDDMWIGTDGGLVKLNKVTDNLTFYNRANAGIPDNQIRSLALDPSGNIWMGTEVGGIGRFDGQTCNVYNTENSGLPHDQWNTAITIGPQGNIWIGSLMYLTIFDGVTWKSYRTGSVLSAYVTIHAIEFDKKGNAWIGASWGLGKLEGENLITYTEVKQEVYSLASDTNDKLWIGTNGRGLIEFDGQRWTVYDTSNSAIPGNIIYALKLDSKGNLWLGTNKGLAQFDGTSWKVYNRTNSALPDDYMFSIEIDGSDNIWIGTFMHGLYKFDGKNWKRYRLSNSVFPCNNIYAIEIVDKQNAWFGTFRGLVNFNGNDWLMYDSTNSGLANTFISSLESDRRGNLWIGARGYKSLMKYDGYNWTIYDSTNSIFKNEWITVLKLDTQNNLWISAFPLGLVKFDEEAWTVYNMKNTPLPSNSIGEIVFDNQGNLWVGISYVAFVSDNGEWVVHQGGLAKFDGHNWVIFQAENSGLPFNNVSALAFDSEGILWIATLEPRIAGIEYGGGLTKFDGTNWTTYNIHNSALTSNSIFDIAVDNEDNLWLGTCAGGLVEFNRETDWTIYNTRNSGISSNTISVVGIDPHGNKWIGHFFEGLSVFREGGVILEVSNKDTDVSSNKTFSLAQNYPNPFNLRTIIAFTVPTDSNVELSIYDLRGQFVRNLINRMYEPGNYQLQWDGRDHSDRAVSSGVYLYVLKTGRERISKKMLVIK